MTQLTFEHSVNKTTLVQFTFAFMYVALAAALSLCFTVLYTIMDALQSSPFDAVFILFGKGWAGPRTRTTTHDRPPIFVNIIMKHSQKTDCAHQPHFLLVLHSWLGFTSNAQAFA